MASSASYLIQTQAVERDSIDWVPELSRRARAIPIYATLRALGRDGVEELINRSCARATDGRSIRHGDRRADTQ